MAKIYKQITDLIGKTPLVELGKYSASKGLETPVIAKVEFFNPGGSIKDRIALLLSVFDHRKCDTILYASARIEEFYLSNHRSLQTLGC